MLVEDQHVQIDTKCTTVHEEVFDLLMYSSTNNVFIVKCFALNNEYIVTVGYIYYIVINLTAASLLLD